ncbi:MAG: right-handed parallel beta-helix repeat-containing protein [Candidatus Eisenbacteria bacterium]|uniref:Right-handed parallel beta-helix repeat-containing protein n=1 Tax=Eiseniibacteriota bacterium TaxID=2212470 RepID=A0A948RXY8_UNCEI|nr:right-handed parallel beta-helix repeat-containing protein [Candidatus Eisenbacteria bacterium]MBU1948897.1 right-handed parallel beta-helix repeat-containing protein [Candidatus Eisenbacteria bacterium]MBU2691618.1 right-handed parallel beta-helix repeat-containing protein [Candidatus Eisenbacteria bacterium]
MSSYPMKIGTHLAIIVLWLCSIEPLKAETYKVPSEHSSIQAGLDAAATGDSVLVAAGTYTGEGNYNLDFAGKNIVLLSEDGADSTTIDCEGGDYGIHFQDDEGRDCVVDGFTIRGADITAIMFKYGASSTIINCVLTGNIVGFGCIGESSCIIEDCLITWNGMSDGAGLYVSHSATPVVKDCVFSGNWSPDVGGAIYIGRDSSLRLEGCLINGCVADDMGGGIFCGVDASVFISNCTISGNGALNGGGIITGGGFVQVENSAVWGNIGTDIIISNGNAIIDCSVLVAPVEWGDSEIEYNGESIFSAPLFCDWVNPHDEPTTEGDYQVYSNSPCLPENNPCGIFIGALGVGCDPPDPTIQRSWGLIKSFYGGR